MLAILSIAAMGKDKEPRNNVQQTNNALKQTNNVHFYVAKDKDNTLWLYMGKPIRVLTEFLSCPYGKIITYEKNFSNYGLNIRNFDNLKWEDEPVEVFLNLED